MNILSIGNSFSQDAQRYLHQIAKADGVELNCYNLYIGGCALSTHYRNMMADAKEYTLQMNGTSTGFFVSIKEALLNRDWDVITLQQALAINYENFQPYLTEIVKYVRQMVPKAKIVLHETWAYEQDSERLNSMLGYKDQKDMYLDIKVSYEKAAYDIKPDYIIHSGTLFQKLLSLGIENLHRDTYHASLGVGRYALGLLWYRMLTGNSVINNSFTDFDEEITGIQIKTAAKCVEEICNE